MKNKKGFTLIELLAVIVILAIIMVIAIPQILNIIDSSRKSSWNNNVKLIKGAIEKSTMISQVNVGNAYTVKGLCNNNETTTDEDVTSKISEIAKLEDTNITCKKDTNYIFTLTGSGQFNGMSGTITCTGESSCTYEVSSFEPAPAPEAFATDSWATIAQNPTSSLYQVGQEKTITMDVDGDNTAETYHIMIINKSECTTEESESACGLVLQFKELLNINNADDKKMNLGGTISGGWPASKMYTYLNETIYNKLPSDLKSVIKTTKTISGDQSGNTNYNYTSNNDKLYLLSAKEVGFNGDSTASLTRVLDYYTNHSKIKYDYGTSNGNHWWLRTVYTNGTNFCIVSNTNEYWTAPPYATWGVAPAFRIGN